MRHVSRRAAVVLVLAGLVLAGLLVFLIQYVFQAKGWAAFPGSPHVYRGNNLTAGTVTDRGGELLIEAAHQHALERHDAHGADRGAQDGEQRDDAHDEAAAQRPTDPPSGRLRRHSGALIM